MKIVLLISLMLFSNLISNSQTGLPEARNSIYFDVGIFIGGTAGNIGCGINYERMIHKNFNVRVGVNICYFSQSGRYDNSKYILGFPLTASYLTSNNNKFEIGLGGGILDVRPGPVDVREICRGFAHRLFADKEACHPRRAQVG